MSGGPYKIRKLTKSRPDAQITVPRRIAEAVGDKQFWCELTEEGILYRPVDLPARASLPSWLRDEAEAAD